MAVMDSSESDNFAADISDESDVVFIWEEVGECKKWEQNEKHMSVFYQVMNDMMNISKIYRNI